MQINAETRGLLNAYKAVYLFEITGGSRREGKEGNPAMIPIRSVNGTCPHPSRQRILHGLAGIGPGNECRLGILIKMYELGIIFFSNRPMLHALILRVHTRREYACQPDICKRIEKARSCMKSLDRLAIFHQLFCRPRFDFTMCTYPAGTPNYRADTWSWPPVDVSMY